ncbi:hypothetical protein [Thalassobacillus sp. C254]|nr:hypothetical protein [Thalassobacillus sp. C254]
MAVGVLLKLGIANSIEEGEEMVKQVRPQVSLHKEFKKDLQKLYNL